VLRFAHRTKQALAQSQQHHQQATTHYQAARQAVDRFGARMAQRLGMVPGTESIRRELLHQTLQ
jgi:hypothetical protein